MIAIRPFDNIVPMIYAYTTPEIARHNGWTKIGYTEKQTVDDRIKQQSHTVDVITHLEWKKEARYTDGGGEYFTDHDFHEYLVRFHNIEREQGTEWFHIDGNTSKKHFYEFAGKDYDEGQKEKTGTQYELRVEQETAVSQTVAYFHQHKDDGLNEFLWNAKPRFGKTLTTYDFARKIDARNVLIVTNRPSIANSWFDDFQKFISWQTKYLFVSECDALSERAVLSREQFIDTANTESRCIAFESLQGLKGSVYFGGKYDKLKWILGINWDLLVIDEAHEGVDTYKTDRAFDNIKRKFTLHLSGTPFKAIGKGKFNKDQIFNWSFSDEQEAKEAWSLKSPLSANPYASLPRMHMFTYQMSKIVQEEVQKGLDLSDGSKAEYAFDLNEFFSTKDGKFVYKKDVEKFLNALTTQLRFPFSTPELREEIKHSFWLMDRVDSAKAMAELLKTHEVFKDYKVIVAAGDGKLEAEDNPENKKSFDRVMEAIKTHDKTITLSVGQLTTGVTVPQWTAVFMLSNMKSPAEYIQAAFRAQNPYKYEQDGKLLRKENCYVFDFSPERSLIVFEEFANSLYSGTANGNGTREEREANIKRLINFFSVYAEDENGEMMPIDAAKVMTIPIAIKADEVIRRGFMSNFLFNNLGNVFGAPSAVIDILRKLKPEEQQGQKNVTGKTIENTDDVRLDEDGNAIPDELEVNRQTEAVFGNKLYESQPESLGIEDVFGSVHDGESEYERNDDSEKQNEPSPAQKFAEIMKEQVTAALADGFDKAKEEYAVKQTEAERLQEQSTKRIGQELSHVVDDFDQKQRILEVERKKQMAAATSSQEAQNVQTEFENKLQEAQQQFLAEMKSKTQEVKEREAKQLIETLETKKEEAKKRDIENDIRAHLRGFCRTIPSFIMAYGDEKLTLANFETYPPDGVFEEVTSITVDEFKFLRDGGDYFNKESGKTEHYPGETFNEVVFNESVQEFLRKKDELKNYFDESSTEDIFDYIPPQETNQIFTPKKVVKMMVDELEKENPHIFEDPDKTFMDLYMKSGLYITEIIKRLYRNAKIKALYPNERERLKHIIENQVYGFAPSSIIFGIAIAYIFGFDKGTEGISREHFYNIDTTPYAKEGTLDKLFDEVIQ